MHIIISQTSPQTINLADYAQQDLTITIASGVQVTCIYDQTNYEKFNIVFHLQHDAMLHCVLLVTGDQLSKINVAIFLDGQGAHATVRGLYALRGAAQTTITTSQHHTSAHTTSNLIIKGLLNDTAKSLYQGTIIVDQCAKQTKALQENKNMLLSPNAQAQSIPSLEVLTNDVHCTHGSASGYLDQHALFYAQTRGIDHQNAQRILLHGFFADILESLPENMVSDICARLDKISA